MEILDENDFHLQWLSNDQLKPDLKRRQKGCVVMFLC